MQADALRASPMAEHLDIAGPLVAWHGGQVLARADAPAPADAGRGLNLLDLSAAARFRFRAGPGQDEQTPGWLVARLPGGDSIALPRPHDAGEAPVPACVRQGTRADPGFAHGYWLYAFGEATGMMFAEGCEIDLRPRSFAQGQVVQTALFKSAVLVMRDDLAGLPAYHILGCCTYAAHVAAHLRRVQHNRGGRIAGLHDLPAMAAD